MFVTEAPESQPIVAPSWTRQKLSLGWETRITSLPTQDPNRASLLLNFWLNQRCSVFLGSCLVVTVAVNWLPVSALPFSSLEQSLGEPNVRADRSLAERPSPEPATLQSTPAAPKTDSIEPPRASPIVSPTPVMFYVNPATGSDRPDVGPQAEAPFKTLSAALEAARPGTVIQLAPGTYSADSGEAFPLQLKPGVTVQGKASDRGQQVILRGGGFFLSRSSGNQNVTLVGADQARLIGVTVINPAPRGYGLWIESSSPEVTDSTFTGNSHDGISVMGNSAPLIRGNVFYRNGANGLMVHGTSRPEIRENLFQETGFGLNITAKAAPQIAGNRILKNRDGIVVQQEARPLLRGNLIAENERSGLAAIGSAQPNLGTAGDPGGNIFRNNGQFDIQGAASRQSIPVFGNDLTPGRSNGQLDWRGETQLPDLSPEDTARWRQLTQQLPVRPLGDRVESPQRQQPPASPTSPQPQTQPRDLPRALSRPGSPAAPGSDRPLPQMPVPTLQPWSQPSSPSPSPKQGQEPDSTGSDRALAQSPDRSGGFPMLPDLPVQFTSPRSPIPVSAKDFPPVPTEAIPPQPSSLARQGNLRLPLPPRANVARGARSSGQPQPATVQRRRSVAEIPVASPAVGQRSAGSSDWANPGLGNAMPGAPRSGSASQRLRAMDLPVQGPGTWSNAGNPWARSTTANTSASSLAATGLAMVEDQLLMPETAPLPVPKTRIPLGNTGDRAFPKITAAHMPWANAPQPIGSIGGPGIPSPRYRVLITAPSLQQQQWIKRFIPAAFPTVVRGRPMMQAGAFGDRAMADSLQRALAAYGFWVQVELL